MGGRASPLLSALLLAVLTVSAPACAETQDFSGRWSYSEDDQTATLDLRHDRATGRVSGTLAWLGASLPVEGTARGAELVIETLAGMPVGATGSMGGRLDGGALLFTVAPNGEAPDTLRMTREGGGAAAAGAPAETESPAAPAPSRASAGFTPASAGDFAGEWQQVNDDETEGEIVQLTASGDAVSGTLTAVERGYYSGNVTTKGTVSLRGTVRNGALEFRAWDPAGTPEQGVSGTAHRRGEYLVLKIGERESGYARPGTPLVKSAEGSAEAAALARAITGRVYSASSQAGGGGAFVGGRVRLALCSDGSIEYDASDLATTPGALPGGGVDMGGTVTRRGSWSIVLVAGEPAVRAQWRGTGSSYSLTAYFRVRPTADGAEVDGIRLPATDRC